MKYFNYNILYKTPTGPKSLLGLIKQMNLLYLLKVKLNILILFDYGSFNKICDKTEYLISKKK